MPYLSRSTLLAAAIAVARACEIPAGTLSNTITAPFAVLVQNPAYPVIHNRLMNLDPAGGGDQHLFLDPVPIRANDLVLTAGAIKRGILQAVINGEYSDVDNTTKMFMTERGDPKAIFSPVYGCDPDTDALQVQLAFQTREQSPFGGAICVRIASGNRGYEFRYSPPNNPAFDASNPCIPVTLIVVPANGALPSSTTSQASTSTTSTSSTRSTTSTTSSTRTSTSTTLSTSTTRTSTTTSSPAGTNTALPYTDMTSLGFSFQGCAPEERRASDGPGRTLPNAVLASDTLTNQICINFCTSRGYLFAGTEYSRECWCGNAVAPGRVPPTTAASLSNCAFRCKGDVTQYCGGDSYLSLYKKCTAGGPCVNAVFT